MVQVYESHNGLILSCFMLNDIRSRSSHQAKTNRQESVGAIFAASEIFHSRDNKIPDAGQQDFLTQSAGCQTHTKSATCTVPMLLARRLQTASAWLDCLHALTTSDFHYHSYDD